MSGMRGNKVVVGVFTFLDDTLKAIKTVKESNLDYRVYSPVPRHEIEEATMPKKSPVRFFTLIGGMTGLTFGYSLAIWTSLDYPMRVSAKDVVSPPGFFPVGYECTILFGALCTLFALLYFCKIPDLMRKVGFDPRFSLDKFGVVVGCDGREVDRIKAKLVASGAEEVQVRDGL